MQNKIINSFNMAALNYSKHAFIQNHVADILIDKYNILNLKTPHVVDVGCGSGYLINKLKHKADIVAIDIALEMCKLVSVPVVCGSAKSLPFKRHSFDVMLSSLVLQWLFDDIDSFFQESLSVIRPGGVLLFSSLGPDTLFELKDVMHEITGHQHVNQQLDMHDVGDRLKQAGFVDVVMDKMHLTIEYNSVRGLLDDLRGVGANINVHENKRVLSKKDYKSLVSLYKEKYSVNGKVTATYEVVFAQAWVGVKNQVALNDVKRA